MEVKFRGSNSKVFEEKILSEIYLYRDGIYVEEARKAINTDTSKILEEHTKTTVTNEIIHKIECKTFVDRDDLGNADKKYICLNNGVLNIETMELLPHSPNFNFMVKIPVNYDPKATCKRIDKVFLEILSPEYVEIIKEWPGAHHQHQTIT